MFTEEDFQKALSQAQSCLDWITPHLPSKTSVAEIGTLAKAPWKAQLIRGALLWRSSELGSDAVRAFSDGHLATANLVTRALLENVALYSRLADLIARHREFTPKDLNEKLDCMSIGWKSDDEFPVAPNVLTTIKHLEKHVPNALKLYDQLSEIAHPNYSGGHGLYAEHDKENYTTYFGPNVRATLPHSNVIILEATLGFHIVTDARFSDAFEGWVQSFPSLDDPRPDDSE